MNAIAKYLRLSSEDEDLGHSSKLESNSISNQRNLLDAYISRMPEFSGTNVVEFCDDGWSGKNFERPAVQDLLLQARQGKIQCIIVKDLSRFGRDYLTVGNYISRVFPFLSLGCASLPSMTASTAFARPMWTAWTHRSGRCSTTSTAATCPEKCEAR